MTPLAAGLLLGIAASAHCLAMCGPLQMAIRSHAAGTGRMVAGGLEYHAGRLTVYAALGLLAGLAGQAVAIGGFGRALAIGAGTLLLISAVGRIRTDGIARSWSVSRLASRGLAAAGRSVRRHPVTGPFLAGGLNGLLPCGMLYGALTAAAGFGRPIEAVLFMTAFGLGTLPALAVLWMAAGPLTRGAGRRLRAAAPIALAVVGVLLIARGVTDAGGVGGHQHAHASEQAHAHAAE